MNQFIDLMQIIEIFDRKPFEYRLFCKDDHKVIIIELKKITTKI